MKLSARTIRAVEKYSLEKCLRAIKFNSLGEGPSNIGYYLGLSFPAANSAICAGRELTTKCGLEWNGNPWDQNSQGNSFPSIELPQ